MKEILKKNNITFHNTMIRIIVCIVILIAQLSSINFITKNNMENIYLLQAIRKVAVNLYSNEEYGEFYYYNQEFYYVRNKKHRLGDIVFLKIMTKNMNNNKIIKIKFEKKEVKLPFWSRYRMAKIDIPMNEEITQVIIGELTDNKEIWSRKINFEEIFSSRSLITLSNLSDANWTNGVNKIYPMLLIVNEEKNRKILQNAKQLKVGKVIANIMNIDSDDTWIRIMCAQDVDLFSFAFPNNIEVIK